MSSNKETMGRTLFVALVVSLVSSVFVAGAAVGLKPIQIENRLLDRQRSILEIAGLIKADAPGSLVKEVFTQRVKARVVDLDTGEYSNGLDPLSYDPLKAAWDPKQSSALKAEDDLALIKRRERFTTVYTIENAGRMEALVLPVRGYGLWSTLHGFMAIKGDLNTILGFGFYQHAETPGLGGEVDNPKWKSLWPGKKLFDAAGKPAIHVIKGNVDAASSAAIHQVDGLAGATLTSKGVDRLVQFWLGEQGFGPYLAKLRASGV